MKLSQHERLFFRKAHETGPLPVARPPAGYGEGLGEGQTDELAQWPAIAQQHPSASELSHHTLDGMSLNNTRKLLVETAVEVGQFLMIESH